MTQDLISTERQAIEDATLQLELAYRTMMQALPRRTFDLNDLSNDGLAFDGARVLLHARSEMSAILTGQSPGSPQIYYGHLAAHFADLSENTPDS
ncbi:MAG: hypothetical protein F4X45_01950 [Chloroflexi bacterium]|nr:hypothetical protein [Chloroflexota bacterium]